MFRLPYGDRLVSRDLGLPIIAAAAFYFMSSYTLRLLPTAVELLSFVILFIAKEDAAALLAGLFPFFSSFKR